MFLGLENCQVILIEQYMKLSANIIYNKGDILYIIIGRLTMTDVVFVYIVDAV